MGASTRKKKEKVKDFQRPKYKVGKTKSKPSNFTDTSFKSKSIVMSQQSLSETAPDALKKFKEHLSQAASSKTDKQRQDSLAYLTGQLDQDKPFNPVGTHTLLVKLLPLISSRANGVRSQLLKLFQTLPPDQVRHDVEKVPLHIMSGMTNISSDVSNDALDFMSWLVNAVGDDLVSCPGGWVKPLKTFAAMLGWSTTTGLKDGWSSGGQATQGRSRNTPNKTKTIETLTQFLQVGLRAEPPPPEKNPREGKWDYLYKIPRDPNAFAYLNLYGPRRDEDGEMYMDRESRQQVYHKRFLEAFDKGIDTVKKEGGKAGRVASTLDDLLKSRDDGMGEYEPSQAMGPEELMDLW